MKSCDVASGWLFSILRLVVASDWLLRNVCLIVASDWLLSIVCLDVLNLVMWPLIGS